MVGGGGGGGGGQRGKAIIATVSWAFSFVFCQLYSIPEERRGEGERRH